MTAHIKTYIKIDNNWFRDKKYILKTSKLAFAIYVLILERVGCDCKAYINIDYLISHLGMNKNNCHMVDRIKQALAALENNQIINFHNNMYDDSTINFVDLNVNKNTSLYVSVDPVKEKYTNIYMHEVFTILFSEYGDYQTKLGMLSQFCYIISCINSMHNVSFPSMTNIMECSAIGSYSTLKDNLDKLVELNLLVYGNANMMNNNGSSLTQSPNHYARPIHESDLKAMVEEKIAKMNKSPMSKNTKELGRLKRSLAQKINHIHKKEEAGSITEDDMISLNEMIEEYNQLCISTGQEPKFNMNAKPQEVIISTEDVESFIVDNKSKVIKLNKPCDPFDDGTDIAQFI